MVGQVDLVEPRVWRRRSATINRYEQRLVAGGTTVVECFLHICEDESTRRLPERLDEPDKRSTFTPGDRRRNWAITNVLVEALEALAASWPEPDYDVDKQRRRLLGRR